ncbi:sulfotransferase, partial [bacterium]|nr:sulfotransferase [bacterium]
TQAVMPFQRPIFIVAAPRSGSTMLFETLRANAAIWSTGDESHQTFESIPELGIAAHGFDSNALSAADASPEVLQRLKLGFLHQFHDAAGGRRPQSLRFLEKTPKNALRIPFLREAFPDAIFIHLVREPRPNLGSIIDAWQSGRFVTYRDLPGWPGPPWSLLLIPGWRNLAGQPLAAIAVAQWAAAHQAILEGLVDLPPDRKCLVRYEDLLQNTAGELQRVCEFTGIPFGPRMQQLCASDLPLSRYTLSRPDPDKWRRHEAAIEAVMPSLDAVRDRLGQ